MKKFLLIMIALTAIVLSVAPVNAGGTEGVPGKISGKSVGAAALSFFVWPGIGQLILDNPYEKNATHALLGLTGIFRFWSCYDAFVDRRGGVWHNRI